MRERATRRHWLRETRAAYRDLTSMFRGASGKWSQFRLVLALFAVQFARHWPAEWNADAVVALAILVFALPVDTLFARVPVAETLGALESFFGGVMGRASERFSAVAGRNGWSGGTTPILGGSSAPSPRAVPEDDR